MPETNKFGKGIHYEERLVQSLIVDHKFAEQMIEVLDFNYFGFDYTKETTKIIFNYYNKYKGFPSFKLLSHLASEAEISDTLKEKIVEFFDTIKNNPLNGDIEYIKESSLDFCRKKSLVGAFEKSIKLIQEKRYEEIVNEIQQALQKGSERDLGHDYLEQFENRMVEDFYEPVETPWPEINKLINGGLGKGKLGVICAPTSVGKSHFLVDVGAYAAMLGKNVLHYTFELSEKDVGKRYDSRISGVPIDDISKHKSAVRDAVESIPGKVIIKSYPTKKATTLTLRNHINRLFIRDFIPDIIIVDYADLMKASKNYEQKRFELESVYEELRALAMELDVPIWTATQTNRVGLDEDIITLAHVAEAYAKAWIVDLFLTMNRRKDAPLVPGKLFVAKNRMGDDGLIFPIRIHTAISKIEFLDPSQVSVDGDSTENQMDRLRRRFEEFEEKNKNPLE